MPKEIIIWYWCPAICQLQLATASIIKKSAEARLTAEALRAIQRILFPASSKQALCQCQLEAKRSL